MGEEEEEEEEMISKSSNTMLTRVGCLQQLQVWRWRLEVTGD